MSDTEFVIRELAPELQSDYLAFFDHDAFADNPQWASCYCHCYYFPHHEKSWKDATAEENRAAVCQLMDTGRMQGYLAYQGGKVVGWCNAAPRPLITALREPETQAEQIGVIVCFIVAKPYRGQGIAHRLLEAACEGLRRQGLSIAEASPRREAPEDAAHNYHGTLSMYLAAGFTPFKEDGNDVVVRKALT